MLHQLSNWRALFGAKGLTLAQIAFWEDALARTVATNEWRKLVEENNLTAKFLRSRDCTTYLEGEYAATKAVMTDLGLIK